MAGAGELLEEKGRDPGAELVIGKRANREAPTVNDLANEYMEKWAVEAATVSARKPYESTRKNKAKSVVSGR